MLHFSVKNIGKEIFTGSEKNAVFFDGLDVADHIFQLSLAVHEKQADSRIVLERGVDNGIWARLMGCGCFEEIFY